jgi:small subunit ribosomal protein S19e|tara:strand:- start:238 stop:702 length:465 start_codon:yes stop_codon:yes gene_type:complete
MNIYDINPQDHNLKLADALKNVVEIKMPEWAGFVKSSSGKERPIDDPDFWHKRTASILRQIYRKKAVGVSRLRTKYGSKKNRGYKPEKFVRAGGKIIRTILQQLDEAGFTETTKPPRGIRGKSGRKLTEKGRAFVEDISDVQSNKQGEVDTNGN